MTQRPGRQADESDGHFPRREWAKALVFVGIVAAAAVGFVIWLAFAFLFQGCACG